MFSDRKSDVSDASHPIVDLESGFQSEYRLLESKEDDADSLLYAERNTERAVHETKGLVRAENKALIKELDACIAILRRDILSRSPSFQTGCYLVTAVPTLGGLTGLLSWGITQCQSQIDSYLTPYTTSVYNITSNIADTCQNLFPLPLNIGCPSSTNLNSVMQECIQSNATVCLDLLNDLESTAGFKNSRMITVGITMGVVSIVVIAATSAKIAFNLWKVMGIEARERIRINACATSCDLRLADNLTEAEQLTQLQLERDRLISIDNRYYCREAFMMGALSLHSGKHNPPPQEIEKRKKKTPISLLFSSNLAEKNLSRTIFEFAGVAPDAPKGPR